MADSLRVVKGARDKRDSWIVNCDQRSALTLQRITVAIGVKLGKESFHRFIHRNTRPPAHSFLEFLVRIALALPFRRAAAPVKSQRKLPL